MPLLIKIIFLFCLMALWTANATEPEINISGLDDQQESNVNAYLSLTDENCLSPHWRVKQLFLNATKEIADALRALGYYHPEIIKKLTFTGDCWEADFEISAGRPVRVKSINVEIIGDARKNSAFQQLLSKLPVKVNDILNHAHYETIKSRLFSLAQEYGYLKARFSKKRLRVDPEKNQANIELIFDAGPQYYFGKITIKQNILTPKFVQGYLKLKTGEQYSRAKLAKTYRAFTNSGYFSHVDVQPELEQIYNNQVPVDINLSPQKKHDFSLGVGYDTDIGPLVTLGYQNRYINHQGHTFSIETDFSPIRSSTEGRYLIPFSVPHQDFFLIAAGYKHENPDTFESDEAKFSVQYQHVYPSGWKQIIAMDLSYEKFTISNVTQSTTLLVPGIQWRYRESNDELRPTQGYLLDFSLRAAPENLISDFTFVQAKATAKLISSLPWSARIISRINLGATLTNDFNRMPTAYRFYAGGTESLRGYGYKKLGPIDDKNNVFGGQFLTLASLEYEHFINDKWGVASFIDGGNAFNTNHITFKAGAGVGVRWLSPIGPIKLDFAIPLQQSDSSYQIHFSAGAAL